MSPRAFHDFTPHEFRTLRSRPLRDYFASYFDTAETPADPLGFPAEVTARFETDFDRLLKCRQGLQGLVRAREFRKWWREQKTAYLTRPVIQKLCETDLSLDGFLDDVHLTYMTRFTEKQEATRIFQLAQKVCRNRVVLTMILSVVFVFQRASGFLWSLAVLGPGVLMVNSYTQPVVTPLAQTASQVGARDLGSVATWIQASLTRRDKMKRASSQIRQVTERLRGTDFASMSPDQAQAKWDEFEHTYFDLFLHFNQTLPSHLRDGRGMFRDWLIVTPIGMAANLSAFDLQYWQHRREAERLRAEAPQERKLIHLHQEQMKAAETRIAATLAAWKVFEFMYPEISRQGGDGTNREIKKAYDAFTRSMRMDIYTHQFAAQVDGILKQLDDDFLLRSPAQS